jgi:hypothetical protein
VTAKPVESASLSDRDVIISLRRGIVSSLVVPSI